MKKSRILISSAMVTLLSATLLAGATYSLFTSESTHDITVGSAKVDVDSTVKEGSFKLSSLGVPQEGNTFANGGTASFNPETGAIILSNITPGDEVEFEIMLNNYSDVKVKYRVLVNVLNNDFGEYFTLTGEGTSWTDLDPNIKEKSAGKFKLSFSKDAGNLLGDKQTKIQIIVEAHQFNDPALKESTISFVTNSDSVINPITKINGYPVSKPADPVKPHHGFLGWYKNETCSEDQKFEFDQNTKMPKENLTLYAKWAINTHNLTLDTKGGTLEQSVTNPKVLEFDATIGELPTPTYTGYDFVGWFMDEAGNTPYNPTNKMPDSDLTIYAKWNEAIRTITFDKVTAPEVKPLSLKVGSTLPTLDVPFKNGEVCLGYFTDKEKTIPFNETLMPNENITLYAKMVPSILNYGYDTINDCYEILNLKENKEYNITKLELPTYYNDGAGNGTKAVKTIKSINTQYIKNITEIIFPKYLENIGDDAFSQASDFPIYPTAAVSLNLPETLKTIGNSAFMNFHAASVNIPKGITNIPEWAFSGSQITSLELNEGLTTIGMYGFSDIKVKDLVIPSTVTKIDGAAFASNMDLRTVKFAPGSKLEVLKGVFNHCELLDYIVLPRSLTTIKGLAFNDYDFNSLIIPKSVVNVGEKAFSSKIQAEKDTYIYIETEEQMQNKATWNENWYENYANLHIVIGRNNWPIEIQNLLPAEDPIK